MEKIVILIVIAAFVFGGGAWWLAASFLSDCRSHQSYEEQARLREQARAQRKWGKV